MQSDHLPASLIDTPGLPTYRQINYWCQGGALGPDKIRTGSGFRRDWSDHEIRKLQLLNQVAKGLTEIGFRNRQGGGIPMELVSRIWFGMDDGQAMTLSHGPVQLTITPENDMNVKHVKHNHMTRDIKEPGVCPGCDEYWEKHDNDHQRERETSNQQKRRRIVTHDSGGGPGAEPGPIDDA